MASPGALKPSVASNVPPAADEAVRAPRFLATIGLYLDTPEKQDSYARFCVNRWRTGEPAHKLSTRFYMALAWHAAEPRDEYWSPDYRRYRPLRPKMLKALATVLGLVTASDMGSRKGLPRPAKKIRDLVDDTFAPLPDLPAETNVAECSAVAAAMVTMQGERKLEGDKGERRRKRITDIHIAHRVTLFRAAAIIGHHGLAIPAEFLRALRLVLGLENNAGQLILHPDILAGLWLRQTGAPPVRRQDLFEKAAKLDGKAFKAQLDATPVDGNETFAEAWAARPSRELAQWYRDRAAEYQLSFPATTLAAEVGVDKNTIKQWRARSDYRRLVIEVPQWWIGGEEYWRVINPAKLQKNPHILT